MSQNTKQFWLSFVGAGVGVLVVVTGFGVWLWTTGGSTAVQIERLGRLEYRVEKLETNDTSNLKSLTKIQTNVEWLVKQAQDAGRY